MIPLPQYTPPFRLLADGSSVGSTKAASRLVPMQSIHGIRTLGQKLPDSCIFGQLMPFRWRCDWAWILLFIGHFMLFLAAINCR